MKKHLLFIAVFILIVGSNFAQDNLIKNGGFDDIEGVLGARTTDTWGMWSDIGGVAEVIEGVVNVTPVAASDNWKMQVEQWDFILENGKTYTVQFDAWADVDRIIALTIEDPANGYALLGTSEDEGATDIDGTMRSKWEINITTEQVTYTLTLSVDKMVETSTPKFAFLMAQTADKVYLDNVSLVEDVSSVSSVKANLLTVYPNPATGFTTIKTEVGTEVNVYNVAGALVSSLIATDKSFNIDLSDLKAGVYMIKAGDKASKLIVK